MNKSNQTSVRKFVLNGFRVEKIIEETYEFEESPGIYARMTGNGGKLIKTEEFPPLTMEEVLKEMWEYEQKHKRFNPLYFNEETYNQFEEALKEIHKHKNQ